MSLDLDEAIKEDQLIEQAEVSTHPFKDISPSVLRIWIRDWVPFRPLDPGWEESQHPDPGSGMNNPDHIF
jgi:hypothetical protein